jgi:hypothetical protein
MWIFGYGSLIFRPSFPDEERREAWLRDWARRYEENITGKEPTLLQFKEAVRGCDPMYESSDAFCGGLGWASLTCRRLQVRPASAHESECTAEVRMGG